MSFIHHRPSPSRLEPEEFLVVSTPADKNVSGSTGSGSGLPPSAPGAVPAPSGLHMTQTGRGGSVVSDYWSIICLTVIDDS